MSAEIPPMTDPLGKYWDQPDRSEIILDDTHALMSQNTFDKLANYSASQPSGVYDGKMWKGFYRLDGWWLRWFAPSTDPNKCAVHSRQILIA